MTGFFKKRILSACFLFAGLSLSGCSSSGDVEEYQPISVSAPSVGVDLYVYNRTTPAYTWDYNNTNLRDLVIVNEDDPNRHEIRYRLESEAPHISFNVPLPSETDFKKASFVVSEDGRTRSAYFTTHFSIIFRDKSKLTFECKLLYGALITDKPICGGDGIELVEIRCQDKVYPMLDNPLGTDLPIKVGVAANAIFPL